MSNTTTLATPAAPRTSALAVMAERLSVDPTKLLSTLKNTVFKGATDDELVALVLVANEYGLNPLTKQLYAFPKKGGGIEAMVPIDGWLKICNDHPQFDGLETRDIDDEHGKLIACECTIYRKDRSHPTVIREYLSECKRATEPWKMERRMLRNKAIIQCSRVAFSLSGIHDEDECADIERRVTGRDRTVGTDPLMEGLGDDLVLTDEPLSLDERLKAKAIELGMPSVETLIVEAAEAGKVPEKALKDLTDAEKEALLV